MAPRDEAREKWVLDNVAWGKRSTAHEAWRAAVKHTLEFVVEDLKKEAERISEPPPAPLIERASVEIIRSVAAFIETMKP